MAFHSGGRAGELLNMRWADVDWKNRIARLPDSKNGKQRNLPFWGGIESHLKAQKKYRDAYHPDCDGGHGHTPSPKRTMRTTMSCLAYCFTTFAVVPSVSCFKRPESLRPKQC